MQKIRKIICIFIIFAPFLYFSKLHSRQWTNKDGQKLIADLTELVDSETIKLRSAQDGRIYTYEVRKLCEADQKFVQEQIDAESKKNAVSQNQNTPAKAVSRRAKWTEDYAEAQKEAKTHDLPMLLLFTGSDWCSYCIQLEEGVFSKRDFKKFADKNIVLMKADFPRSNQKAAIKKQNAKLKKEFKVSGYPSVFILSPSGKRLGRIHGYDRWSEDEYIQKIEKLIKK